MFRIAICDDVKLICNEIKNIILENKELQNEKIKIDIFNNGETLIEELRENTQYDLIFLDIELGEINGVEVGHIIRDDMEDYTTKIVYISGKNSYDRQLFNVQPMKFISKPIEEEKVIKAVLLAIKISDKKIINSGNVIVDSIVNYKLESLGADNVELLVNINIPVKMKVSDFDLTTILGNLLDNAIRAVKETGDKKYLSIDIQHKSGRLIIRLVNSYKYVEKSKIGNYFISTKENRNKHGIGQINIERTVDKYDGILYHMQ